MSRRTETMTAREAQIERAVELGVDRDDFDLDGGAERALWADVEVEFEEIRRRLGPTWVAET